MYFLKVETIGDAYICAGGLNEKCTYHACRILWMGLLMVESAGNNYTNTGDKIKVRNNN